MKNSIAFFVLLVCMFLVVSCDKALEIRIGFIGTLSGRLAEEGEETRNSVLMALEEINEAGGINGKKLRLIIRDDQDNPQIAQKVMRELIDENVAAVIGPTHGPMTEAVLPVLMKRKILMITPGRILGFKEDRGQYILRMHNDETQMLNKLADWVGLEKKPKQVAVIYENFHPQYQEKMAHFLSERLERFKNLTVFQTGFSDLEREALSKIVRQAVLVNPDIVIIIADARSSAVLCQKIKALKPRAQLYIYHEAMTGQFIKSAGTGAQGVKVLNDADYIGESNKDHPFTARYRERFGFRAGRFARNGYEAMQVLKTALLKVKRKSAYKLWQAIIQQRNFLGIYGDIVINSNGERQSPVSFYQVKNLSFVRIN